MWLFEALILYLDSMFVILFMVELATPSAWEEETVLNSNPIQLGEAGHSGVHLGLPSPSTVPRAFSVLEELLSLGIIIIIIIASSVRSFLFLSLKSSQFLSEKYPSSASQMSSTSVNKHNVTETVFISLLNISWYSILDLKVYSRGPEPEVLEPNKFKVI